MTENIFEKLPDFLRPLVQPGKEADGSYTVSVLFRVTPNDEIALRGEYLIDPSSSANGEVAADWGIEAALVRKFSELLSPLRDEALTFGQTDVRCGQTMGAVPPTQ